MAIYIAKTFDPAAIRFGQPERNKLGGKYVPLINDTGSKTRFTLQFPAMNLPFGISAYREKPEADPISFSADLSFRGYESNDNILMLYNKINELDTLLIEAAHENSVAWFGKQKSRELLEDTYRRLTKTDPSGKYAPVMKIKIPILGGKPNVQVFDVDKTPISIEDVPRGSTVKVIAEIASVWFVGGTNWGVTWRALQILIVDKPARLSDFAFVAEDGENTPVTKDILEISDEDDAASMANKFM
jgi:hypothetical protein